MNLLKPILSLAWLPLAVGALSACAPDSGPMSHEQQEVVSDTEDDEVAGIDGTDDAEKLLNGVLTRERPEVGQLSVGCTGTLVSPDVVITAAHCVNYDTALQASRRGTFTIQAADGSSQDYTVEQYVSYGRQVGGDDISLLRLATSVPAAVARPAPIASADPQAGGALTVFGYGCTQRGYSTDWQKRKANFAMGSASANLCPGDSGGPVFDARAGAVLRINSGYWLDANGHDIFGHVPGLFARLRPQIETWTRGGVVPDPGPGPDGPSPPDAPVPPDDADEQAPTVSILSPAEGATAAPNSNVVISVDITDDTGVSSAALDWNYNGNAYPCPLNQSNVKCVIDGQRYRWTVTVGAEAARPFLIRASDAAGNEGRSATRTVTVTSGGGGGADARPPVVEILAPSPRDTWTSNTAVRVVALASDDRRVQSADLVWAFNGQRYGCPLQSQYVDCALDGEVRTWTLRVSTGRRDFHIEARDTSGNVGRSRTLGFDLR